MKFLLGEFLHSIDERGRVILPKKIRFELGNENIVLAKGFDKCIFGFDRNNWESESKKHLEMPIIDEYARKLRRYLFSSAEIIELDKLGRILIPQTLKIYAEITKDVYVIGAGDHFEIWDKNNWNNYAKKMDVI